ncbi:Rtr1/RPAP2 family-domain-containing protein [Fimicolochytrium jonesii]|uniref:Rtr1/RPAP2 family-domain-containing protein n=1 Tax=Fimicolochytrium jonesii TaxID=1396493 RepID=UPI0022FDBC9D|nr:Rtr1/RPAP2 family-domain-containing protein [Fimicolochytrium jonesii]KAI8818424.1 Rtr1/RPAP2 family-domain-containing protein [Fimicolochytrium jonesii]
MHAPPAPSPLSERGAGLPGNSSSGKLKSGLKGDRVAKARTVNQKAAAQSAALKAAWERKIFAVQRRLFEGAVAQQHLAAAAKYLSQSDYDDVVTERVADKLCGYPLCDKPVTEIKGKFRISRAEQKVFDITDLKKFCSSACMASSDYFRGQLSEEPVYMTNTRRTAPVEVIPVAFSSSDAESIVGIPATPPSRNKLVSSYVQHLLAEVTTKTKETVVVSERKVEEIPSAPVAIADASSIAADIEGYTFRVRKVAKRRAKGKASDLEKVGPSTTPVKEPEHGSNVAGTESTQQKSAAAFPDQTHPIIPTILVDGEIPVATAKGKIRTPRNGPTAPHRPIHPTVFKSDRVLESFAPTDNTNRTGQPSRDQTSAALPPGQRGRKKLDLKLSLFGKTVTTLGRIITRETKTYVASTDEKPVAAPETEETRIRKQIFCQRIVAILSLMSREYQISTNIHQDLSDLIATLSLTEATVMLPTLEEWVLGVILLKVLCKRSPVLAGEVDFDAKWEMMLARADISLVQFGIFVGMFR